MVAREFIDCHGGIVHANLRGLVTDKTWSYVFCKTLAMAGIHQTRNLLIDLRESQLPADALVAYYLPPVLEYIRLTRLYKIALVMDIAVREHNFYETVFNDRGFVIQMFTDYDQARNWFNPTDDLLN